jgi:hypothetical protein
MNPFQKDGEMSWNDNAVFNVINIQDLLNLTAMATVRVPVRFKFLFFLRVVHTGSGAHPASY